jgi:hypothetical protein
VLWNVSYEPWFESLLRTQTYSTNPPASWLTLAARNVPVVFRTTYVSLLRAGPRRRTKSGWMSRLFGRWSKQWTGSDPTDLLPPNPPQPRLRDVLIRALAAAIEPALKLANADGLLGLGLL